MLDAYHAFMDQRIPYAIGAQVSCTDGHCGTLLRVIVNPVMKTVTHLVVGGGRASTRLVPMVLVGSGDADLVHLTCTGDKFEALEPAEVTEFVPATRDDLGYPAEQVHWLPYYPLGPIGSMGLHIADPVTYDRVPSGDVQIRRGEPVHALDGDIGRVQGLVVDRTDNAVTHVLLAEGHLWGKKDVAIPIKAVTEVVGGVHLNLSKDQVRDLPSVEIGQIG